MRALRNELIWFSLVVITLLAGLACFSVFAVSHPKEWKCTKGDGIETCEAYGGSVKMKGNARVDESPDKVVFRAGTDYQCAWIDCHPNPNGKGEMVCEGPKTGTSEELSEVIKNNEHGAVSYDCGPGRKK